MSAFFLARQRHSYGTVGTYCPSGPLLCETARARVTSYQYVAYIRRGWDSNPRGSYPNLGFQDRYHSRSVTPPSHERYHLRADPTRMPWPLPNQAVPTSV